MANNHHRKHVSGKVFKARPSDEVRVCHLMHPQRAKNDRELTLTILTGETSTGFKIQRISNEFFRAPNPLLLHTTG